jgi:hypothetical protein
MLNTAPYERALTLPQEILLAVNLHASHVLHHDPVLAPVVMWLSILILQNHSLTICRYLQRCRAIVKREAIWYAPDVFLMVIFASQFVFLEGL